MQNINYTHWNFLIAAKLCIAYETANFKNGESLENVADVELTFINNDVVTFELDEPKIMGESGQMCKYLTADNEVKDVSIRQRSSDVAWAIQTLKLPKYVGSIFSYAYSLTGRNEMFWVDKNGDCTRNVQGGECCKDGEWCGLKMVEAGIFKLYHSKPLIRRIIYIYIGTLKLSWV